jgi:hypothetical protein
MPSPLMPSGLVSKILQSRPVEHPDLAGRR